MDSGCLLVPFLVSESRLTTTKSVILTISSFSMKWSNTVCMGRNCITVSDASCKNNTYMLCGSESWIVRLEKKTPKLGLLTMDY